MRNLQLRRILKYVAVGAVTGGTYLSLRANDYQINSIGIVRLSRAASTVFQIGSLYKRNIYKDDLDQESQESQEYKSLKSNCHKQAAEKLLELCCINKGVYIKVGQHIAALDYLLPKEYVQTMKVLHSHAPSNNIQDVYKVIREDLKQQPEELFASFDPEPIGTASLAQVHKATLKDGYVVAVKVQHPYVQGNATVDMKTMEVLAKMVSWFFPEFNFQWLVDETKKNIPRELDFKQEGQNAEQVAGMFKHLNWLIIPKIRWDYTTSRVLTMEFVEGGQVNDLKYIEENRINPFEVTEKLGELYSQMIFINGFVHSDPHPGNILLHKSKRGDCNIVLLDHGLYASLTNEFRVEYSLLWLSILNRDRVAMRQHSGKLGIHGDLYGLFACMVTGRTWDTIMEGIDRRKQTVKEKEMMQKVFPNILPQISGILENVDRQMLLILKTNDLMRGIEHTLQTSSRMGAFRVMSQCCVRSVYKNKRDGTTSRLHKWRISLTLHWILFKLNVYYAVLNLSQICNTVINLGHRRLQIIER